MLEYLKGNLRFSTMMLMVTNLLLSLTQILFTSWCSVSASEYYGYFVEGDSVHSCITENPVANIIRVAGLGTLALGLLLLFYDLIETRNKWMKSKSINISRIAFVLSFIGLNSTLEILATATPFQRKYEPWLFAILDQFYWLFPLFLVLVVVSGASIVMKLELHWYLNTNRKKR